MTLRQWLWCFFTGHSRWVVRYHYSDGSVSSPDYYERPRAWQRFDTPVEHLSDDLLKLELIDGGRVIGSRRFVLERGHHLVETT